MTSPTPPAEPQYADRTYRSGAALVCGVLLLLLSVWMAGDAMIRGEGRVPWLALAALITVVPLIVAFTLRPAVFANDDRVRIRNPFRTVQLPWTDVATIRAAYSSELVDTAGTKFQLWAIPVSLRARKKAARKSARATTADSYGRAGRLSGRLAAGDDVRDAAAGVAPADQAVRDLRELAERAGGLGAEDRPAHDGGSRAAVRWAYELMAPAAVGAILLAVLGATG
ncbi:hypothetical protein EES43_18555 [Streptomyces sp. ADI96-02]|uniref:PH domain-containing protein n=1 Tax=unclassified Streptomyces TaxID=2593676 RepID=UPI000F558756|nr:PH domain-containing protein [Streptomyces sp. ADI96-02]RPK59498.1 hypothetical protein EES43_18555 [Streptomyces sp. ADI96-02]